MAYVFCGRTAMWLWRGLYRIDGPLSRKESRRMLAEAEVAQTPLMQKDWEMNGLLHGRWRGPGKIEVLGRGTDRRGRNYVHVRPAPPDTELYEVVAVPNTFVTSPALTLGCVGRELDLVSTALLAMELCGTYAMFPDLARSSASRNFSRATVGDLASAYASRDLGNYHMARTALEYVGNGSNSPMESKVWLLMVMPAVLGGLQMPRPVMNRRIDLTPRAATFCTSDWLCPDWIWPENRIALEYDSFKYHSAKKHQTEAHEREVQMRTTALQCMGINLWSLRTNMLYDYAMYASFMESLKTALGLRPRARKTQYHTDLAVFQHDNILTMLDPLPLFTSTNPTKLTK